MRNTQSVHELQTFKEAAERIIRESRTLIVDRLSTGFSYKLKPDDSFVTDVDLAVENLVRCKIRDAFPDHDVLGEEESGISTGADYVWVIDPVDGTHSLRHGIPLFGTLLALRHRQRSILGIIDLPALDKTYVAVSGLGAHCNGRKLQLQDVTSEDVLHHEIIAIGERKQFVKAEKAAEFDILMQSHSSVRTYCDCFGHALAVEGCVGAMVDYNLRIWDIAATEVLILEAGGMFVHVNACSTEEARDERYNVVFGKPTVVKWILNTIGAEADI